MLLLMLQKSNLFVLRHWIEVFLQIFQQNFKRRFVRIGWVQLREKGVSDILSAPTRAYKQILTTDEK